MVDKNDTFTREVEEELRRDQMAKLFEQYGTYFLAAAVAVVVAVAGFKYYQHSQSTAAETAGARFVQAQKLVSEGKTDDALKAFSVLSTSAPGAYPVLSELQVAGLDARSGRNEQALATYEKVAKSGSADPLLRGFAQLQAAAMRMPAADFTEIQNRLNDLAAADNPWHANARELLALAAMKAGKLDVARTTLEQLMGDRRTPPSVVERTRMALSRIVAAEQAAKDAPASSGSEGKPAPDASVDKGGKPADGK